MAERGSLLAPRSLARALALIAVLGYAAIELAQIRPSSDYFWDFRVYRYAAEAWAAGLDPYRMDSLRSVCGCAIPLVYVYPPVTLGAFRPMLALPFEVAFYAHLALVAAASAALVVLYARRWGGAAGPAPTAVVAFLFLFAFAETGNTALYTGNLVTVEVLLLWLGLEAFVRGEEPRAVALLAVASSFKILPSALLAPLALLPVPRRLKAIAVLPGVAVALGLVVQLVAAPERFRAWRGALAETGWERGSVNPSSLAWIGDLVPSSARFGLYALLVCAVLAALVVGLRGRVGAMLRDEAGRRDLVLLLAAAFVIVAPRFKDYSYVFAIPPLVRASQVASAARSAVRRVAGVIGLLSLAVVPFASVLPVPSPRALAWLAEYQPWLAASVVFGVLWSNVRRPTAAPT